MLIIAGTIPIKEIPLLYGTTNMNRNLLEIEGYRIPCTQGTSVLISSAMAASEYLEIAPPDVIIAGDIGDGSGSRKIYSYLIENIDRIKPDVLALHYCLPNMGLMKRLVKSVGKCRKKISLLADASSMYAAKAAGIAGKFDVFTPDFSEIGFLADPEATHPAYIRKHLFSKNDNDMPELVSMAYRYNNAAKLLLIKGSTDYLVINNKIIETISEPDVPELEAIGGTGDTITGLLSAFMNAKFEHCKAAYISAKTNRIAGKLIEATPATKVSEVIAVFKDVFNQYLNEWDKISINKV